MRRLTNEMTYRIYTCRAEYLVVLERLKNGTYGQPRYKARVIVNRVVGEHYGRTAYTAVYTFTGHYIGDEKEAEWIVTRFEEDSDD